MRIEIIAGWVLMVLIQYTWQNACAELRPEKIHVADDKKTKTYIHDGLLIGGDRTVDASVKSIRRSAQHDFERIVIDLERNTEDSPKELQRPPYYQIAITPDENRLIVSLWAQPHLSFDSKKVIPTFKRSAIIQDIVLLPPGLEDKIWTFMFDLKFAALIEAFELSGPVRIIMDVKPKKVSAKHEV